MKRKSQYLLGIVALSLASCADWYTEHQLPAPEAPITAQEVFTTTLSDKDYESISTNPRIIAIAHEIDETDTTLVPTDSLTYRALLRLGTTRCFESEEHMGYFLPPFLQENYLGASMPDNEGSTFKVTARVMNKIPDYLKAFTKLKEYTLKDGYDYKLMESNNNWLTDANFTSENLGWLMLEYFDDASPLDMYVLHYNQGKANNPASKIVQLGEDGYWNVYEIEGVSIFVLERDFYESIHADYATKPATQLPIYLKTALPYAEADAAYCVVYKNASGWTASRFTYDGNSWQMLLESKVKTTNFILTNSAWAISPYYLAETFANNSQGEFTIQNVVMPAALSYVWNTSSSYGMKASAYVSSTNHETESWLVSPYIALTDADNPVLTFDQASKFFLNFNEELSVWGSTDYAGDVTACTWTRIPFNQDADGKYIVPDGTDWTFYNTGSLSLAPFKGKTLTIGFKYTSSTSAAATWEVKNVYVKEKE
ncbi:MAG: choice-of-anchor J domain-containing protein [Paludibacteraceae bacterium]